MKRRMIYKNHHLRWLIKELKNYKCTYKIGRNKHFKVEVTNLDNNLKHSMTISSSPSDRNYEIYLKKEFYYCLNKIGIDNSFIKD
jgi:hypothetical protein